MGLKPIGQQQFGAHVLNRDVVARRQVGLEQKPGPPRIGRDPAVDDHAHASGGPP